MERTFHRWPLTHAAFWRLASVGILLFCVLPHLTAGELRPVGNIFKPLSAPAEAVYEVSLLALLICAVIFLVVAGLITFAMIKFRARPGDEGKEPPQIYGSNQLEMAWTVIPILIVVVLALVTARTIADVQNQKLPRPGNGSRT